MTLEEAIVVLEESKRQNEIMRDNPSTFWASYQMADGIKNSGKRIAALDLALTALRAPTREMVERMFSGCEVCKNAKYVTGSVSAVAPYDDQHETETYAEGDFDFCPNCGAPMTDEAVEMVMERLEALNEM